MQALVLSDTIIGNHLQANSGFDTPSTGSGKGTKAGDVEAMNMPAMIYEQGMGVEADDETAKSWRMHARMATANRERKEAR